MVEPFSELGDYLDKDDFSEIVDGIVSLVEKTSSGILSLGESILKQFAAKNQEESKEGVSADSNEAVVSGQEPLLPSFDENSSR